MRNKKVSKSKNWKWIGDCLTLLLSTIEYLCVQPDQYCNQKLRRWECDRDLQQSCAELANSLIKAVSTKTTYVTPDNETRLAINNAFIAELAESLPNGHYPIRVVAKFNGGLNGKSAEDISKVMSLPDSRFHKLAPYIDIVPGTVHIYFVYTTNFLKTFQECQLLSTTI